MTAWAESRRWWSCPQCIAINDGDDGSECWNCGYVLLGDKKTPWCKVGLKQCQHCSIRYVIWVSPHEPELEYGYCPRYYEHYGDNAYTSPEAPGFLILRANGYRYDEAKEKVVKDGRENLRTRLDSEDRT